MMPSSVWIFSGANARFPAGVFSALDPAEEWIAANGLTGTLTEYPLDEGAFDWALRTGRVTGRARERGGEPEFVGGFSSATQAHHHYELGVRTA